MAWDGAGALSALGVRLTKLDQTGAPLVGPDNCYTTNAFVRIGFGETYSEPEPVEQRNGRGEVCVYYSAPAVLLGGTIEEFEFCTPDPYVLQWAIGGDVITTGGTSEVQTVTITGTPTGGSFTLSFNGQTTSSIAYNAAAAAVQTALRALSGIGASGVTVTGGPGPGTPWVVTFAGPLANQNVTQMTATASLTGGSSPAVAVTTTTPGAAGSTATGYQSPEVNVDSVPNGIAVEAWSYAVLDNDIAATLPYEHWVFPKAKLRRSGSMSLNAEEATRPIFEGTTFQNGNFGSGPLDDIEFPTGRLWQFNRVDELPDLSPGLIAVT